MWLARRSWDSPRRVDMRERPGKGADDPPARFEGDCGTGIMGLIPGFGPVAGESGRKKPVSALTETWLTPAYNWSRQCGDRPISPGAGDVIKGGYRAGFFGSKGSSGQPGRSERQQPQPRGAAHQGFTACKITSTRPIGRRSGLRAGMHGGSHDLRRLVAKT